MSAGKGEMQLLIENYVDGRMTREEREQFEARMRTDAELRREVETTTQSVELLRKFLVKIEPGKDFEERVSSQIISITQSNQMLGPYAQAGLRHTKLTAKDPDATLLEDPVASRERRRLMIVAGLAAVVFAAAVATIALLLMSQSS